MARTLTQPGPERANRLIFIGALALAALAAVLVFIALSKFGGGGNDNASLGATVDVVVASQEIKAGTKIDAGMLETATLPRNGTIAGALTDKSAAVGLTARQTLARGEQLSDVKLGQTSATRTFSDVIPEGKRAVAVSVVETTNVGGLVVAGDRVDVIVIGKKKTANESDPTNNLPTSFTLLQDIEVLSVAQTAQQPAARLDKDGNPIQTDTAAGNTAQRPSDTDPSKSARTVTLAVDPNQAASLALASESYTVYLALRPNGDKGTVNNPNDLITLPIQ